MRVLLLNPPFSRPLQRGNYCSSFPKGPQVYPPVDLVFVSAILRPHHDVDMIDAVAERIGATECMRRAEAYRPDAVVFTTASVSEHEDVALITELRSRLPGLVVVGTGNYLLFDARRSLERHHTIDGALLDFASQQFLPFLDGQRSGLTQIAHRDSQWNSDEPAVYGKPYGERVKGSFSIGVPRHDLFVRIPYGLPHGIRRPMALTMWGVGCAYSCEYCHMHRVVAKKRLLAELIEELVHIRTLGIREVFFLDQTFTFLRGDVVALCEAMVRERLNLSWICITRVDKVDRELLVRMRAAGCPSGRREEKLNDPNSLPAPESTRDRRGVTSR